MIRILSPLFFLFALLNADDVVLERIFKEFNVKGTLVIATLKSDKLYVYNQKRANMRFCAASTFKIPHTLIALNENIVVSKNDRIKWDGIVRGYALWDKNQTLQSAIQTSCVWCYQKFSQKISKEKYVSYLSKFNYGNKRVGKDKSAFWLNDDLKISAFEQIEFLKKFYSENLSIPKNNIDIVKDMLIIEKNELFTLRAKSGWNGILGWYVGYVGTSKEVYFFALNADIKKEGLHLRKEIVYQALKFKNIL